MSRKKYDANKVVISPIDNVIAKPLTGPEPNKDKIIEAINVVILASNIVTIDFLNPMIKCLNVITFFFKLFFNSFKYQNISIYRHSNC